MMPELPLKETFYPYGFPTEVRTNAVEVLTQCRESWGAFYKLFDTEPIQIEVHVEDSDSTECPPPLRYRIMQPLMIAVADANNYIVNDLSQNRTQFFTTSPTFNISLWTAWPYATSGRGTQKGFTPLVWLWTSVGCSFAATQAQANRPSRTPAHERGGPM